MGKKIWPILLGVVMIIRGGMKIASEDESDTFGYIFIGLGLVTLFAGLFAKEKKS